MKIIARTLLVALVLAMGLSQDTHAQTVPDSLNWAASLDNIGATLTRIKQNPDPAQSLYITDIVATSTTTTAGLMLLQYGTGSNCGTGTTSLFPAAASVTRIGYPANTSAPAVMQFMTSLKVPAGNDLCVLGTATNTVTIQIGGYLKP